MGARKSSSFRHFIYNEGGPPCVDSDAAAVIRSYYRRFWHRRQNGDSSGRSPIQKRQILGLIAGGPKPAYQIAQELPWNVGDRWTRLDPLVKRFAVMETIAHLELFRMDAQVRRFTEKGIIYYEMSSP